MISLFLIIGSCWSPQIINNLLTKHSQLMTNYNFEYNNIYDDVHVRDIDNIFGAINEYEHLYIGKTPILFSCHETLYNERRKQYNIKGIAWGDIYNHRTAARAAITYGTVLQSFHVLSHELGHLLGLDHSVTGCDNFMASCNVLSNYNYTVQQWNQIDLYIEKLNKKLI